MSFSVIGLGEVLWDLLPTGPQLGGAPANFACHALALGAQAELVTRVGNDQLGCEVIERFRGMNLPVRAVQVDALRPTGTVAITLSRGGIPEFTIPEGVAWDHLIVTDEARQAVDQADAVCFGSLAQRSPASRATIQKLLAMAPKKALRIFDVNLRQQFYSREVISESLQLANVLKLNTDELTRLGELFELPVGVKGRMRALAESYDLNVVALTCGPNGSLVYREGCWSEQGAQDSAVVDTIGAGDAFTAALTLGMLNHLELEAVHAFAAAVARFVCSQAGATPPLPATFREMLAQKIIA